MQFNYAGKSFVINGVNDDDYIYQSIKKAAAFYELDLLEYIGFILDSKGEKNTLGIDVGANIGNHSVFFGTFLADFLLSIEPNPTVLPVLKNNLRSNVANYTLMECGVGDQAGTAMISVPKGAEKNIGMAKLSVSGSEGTIEVKTLDSIFEEKFIEDGKPNYIPRFIKIDVEGMELSVLKGAKQIIDTFKPDLFVEAPTAEEYLQIASFLDEFGYEKISRWAATPVYHFAYRPDFNKKLKAVIFKFKHQLRSRYRRMLKLFG